MLLNQTDVAVGHHNLKQKQWDRHGDYMYESGYEYSSEETTETSSETDARLQFGWM